MSQLINNTDNTAYLKSLVKLSEQVKENGGQENKPRRFELVAHSGNVMESWTDFIIDLSGMRFDEKIPVLLEHEYDKPVGVVDTVFFDADKGLILLGYFCGTAEADKIIFLLSEGFPYQVSVGVSAEEILYLSDKEAAVVNNKLVEGPLRVWKKSYVREASFTALGWDPDTSAKLLTKQKKGVHDMAKPNEENQQTANPQHENAVNLSVHPEHAAPKEPKQSMANGAAELSAAQIAENAAQEERSRISGITALCAKFNLTELSAELIGSGSSIELARELVLEKLSAQKENQKLGSVQIAADEKDKLHAALVDGLSLSMGYRKKDGEKLAGNAEQFRNLTFQSLARNLLEQNGVKTLNMSKTDIADHIVGHKQLSASTSDFKGIFLDAMNKVLIGAYKQATATWKPIVDTIPASDFKEIHGIELSGGSDLELVGENEEYRIGKFTDSRESYALSKYGKIFELSYEMIVNDDMGALRKLPMMFANIAARNNSNVIYGLLNGNPALSDGNPLFSADRGNIAEAAGGLTSENLEKAVDVLSAQKGLAGETLGLQAEYLLCAPTERIKAQILLKSAAYVGENMSSGIYNPWAESGIMPVIEERLRTAADGKKYFYVLASPYIQPVIGVSFLNGKESPDIVEDTKFNTDGFAYKVRNVMGAGILSSRGIVRVEIK